MNNKMLNMLLEKTEKEIQECKESMEELEVNFKHENIKLILLLNNKKTSLVKTHNDLLNLKKQLLNIN